MAFALWITGPPASGKSTIARILASELKKRGVNAQILESDELRRILTPGPTYTEEERQHFYQVLVYIAQLLARNHVNVIIDATANREAYRRHAKELIPQLMMVHLTCGLETRRRRDVKGLYKAASEGKVTTLPGLHTPYEEPQRPDLLINTDEVNPAEAASRILHLLESRAASS